MEQYKSKREGMIHGYGVLLYFPPPVLVFCFIIARAIVKSYLKGMEEEKSPRVGDAMNVHS